MIVRDFPPAVRYEIEFYPNSTAIVTIVHLDSVGSRPGRSETTRYQRRGNLGWEFGETNPAQGFTLGERTADWFSDMMDEALSEWGRENLNFPDSDYEGE